MARRAISSSKKQTNAQTRAAARSSEPVAAETSRRGRKAKLVMPEQVEPSLVDSFFPGGQEATDTGAEVGSNPPAKARRGRKPKAHPDAGMPPTILHMVTTNLDEGLHAMRTTESRALRFIARKSGVRWWGYREVKLLRPADLPNFSERKRSMLLAMGFPTNATSPVALFHTHSIVDLGSCDEGMLDALLRKRWGASRQVHVHTFMERRTVRESIRRLTLYSVKARYTREVGEDRREWLDESEMVHLALFLHRSSRGHQSYRFTNNV